MCDDYPLCPHRGPRIAALPGEVQHCRVLGMANKDCPLRKRYCLGCTKAEPSRRESSDTVERLKNIFGMK